MEGQSRFSYSSFMESVGERRLQRFYPWILLGLVFFYIGTFKWLSPMAVAVPVLVAAWFYHKTGALIASTLAFITNIFLILFGLYNLNPGGPNDLTNAFWTGHIFIIFLSLTVGYFREEVERHHETDKRIQMRERHLYLINMTTKEILEGGELNDMYFRLLTHLTNLVTADRACLATWDETSRTLSLAATTYPTDQPCCVIPLQEEEIFTIASVLDARHVMFLEDVRQPPQLADLYSFNTIGSSARSAILIPLATHDFRLGIVVLGFDTPQSFDREEISYIELTSQQVTLALRGVQQEHQIEQQLRIDNALISIGRALSESERIGTGEVMQLIVDSARELMPHAEKSVIHLLDVEEQALHASAVSGFEEVEREDKGFRMRLGEGIAGRVIHEGVTINIGDVRTNPNYISLNVMPSYRSLLVAPVQSSGVQIGTISVQSDQPNAFSNKDAELLNALAVQAAIAIENTRLFEKTQQSLKEVNILYQISRGLAASLDVDQLIRDMIGHLQQFFGYYHVQIYLLDPATRNLVLKHGSGIVGEQLVESGYQLSAGEGIVGHVAETGEPFIANNVETVIFFKPNSLLPQTQSEIAVPIKIDQHVSGVLDIQQTAPHRFSNNDLQLMITIADQLAAVLQKANLYSNLQTSLRQEQMIRSQLLQSERLALVGRLLASVSHELNNPLQAIQNALFLLKEESGLSSQGSQDLDIVLSETERMAALIERLRTAYRPVRGKDFQPVQLNNLIEDVFALIGTHMRHKSILFEFIPDPDLHPVSGISDQLRQVVLNLFLNAVEVMKPGGRLTVQTRNMIEKREVLFTVKDTGPGIDEEILPRIFDAFITNKHTGTGLGLTITHDILEQHHGRINAENDPQGGAVFHVWLPMAEKG